MEPLETAIAIRAYSERPGRKPVGAKPPSADVETSRWTLVFDCETAIDATQRLRFGFYQVRDGGELYEEGLFYDASATTRAEQALVRRYAESRDLRLLTVEVFRSDVFLKYGYTRGGTIVGFNLPFDLSRIAIDHGSARFHMRGGFSFVLTNNRDDPRVRVKHLNGHAALIDFSKPGEEETPRGMRKRGLRSVTNRGHFVDLKTLARALLSRPFSLGSLAEYLDTPTQKLATDEHGTITTTYLDYGRADVQATWECFCALTQRYAEHGLERSSDRLLSEASIGKGYFQKIGVKPLLACDPDFPRSHFGEILCGYYGGRAEIRNRREIHEVIYCDFKSMYPTVNSLMGLWEFVIAETVNIEETTKATRAVLELLSIDDLQQPRTWRNLCTLVLVKPDHDVFPVRTDYDGETYTIGLNYLTTNKPLWFTLADCIVSKLITGRCPEIVKAQTYRPGPRQKDLQAVEILGRPDFRIDPLKDDLFTRLIDLRDDAKEKRDEIEKAIKIIANSSSYGIFIEVNRNDGEKSELLHVYGPHGGLSEVRSKSMEEPGRYFHPILGVLITGAARLMLGIAERKAADLGLDWAFCDTDSFAFVRPKGIPRKQFRGRVQGIVDWFEPLNPYRKPGSILKIEGLNFGISSKKMEPLYCFAISAKRYALFNLDAQEKPVLRKASAHGLGHLIDPYGEVDASPGLPKPRVPLHEIGVKRWHHDLWIKIIQAALDGHPDQVALDWHPALSRPAAIRYTASSPALLAWMKRWNTGKLYDEQIRAFGFLLAFMPRIGLFAKPQIVTGEAARRGRPRKTSKLKPIAPYNSDPQRALRSVFDRVTGESIDPEQLKSYAEVLSQYHLSPEAKFSNGRYLDRGRTGRRHVVATDLVLIGKEANQVGQSGESDAVVSPVRALVELASAGSV
jgi:hypothetical protein